MLLVDTDSRETDGQMGRNQLFTSRLAWRLASPQMPGRSREGKTRYRISRGISSQEARVVALFFFPPPPLSPCFICSGGWYHQQYWSPRPAGEKKGNAITFPGSSAQERVRRTILYNARDSVPFCFSWRMNGRALLLVLQLPPVMSPGISPDG